MTLPAGGRWGRLRAAAVLGLALTLLVALVLPAAAQRQSRQPTSDPIDRVLRQAHSLSRQGRTAQAVKLIEGFLDEHAQDRRVITALGSAYSSNGEDLKAAALYEKAIYEQGMKELDLWTLLAKACRRAGDGERAVSALIACLRWRPSWVGRLKDQFELLATDPEVGPESIAALEAASLPEEARGAWQEILAHVYMVTGEGQKALDLVLTLDREKKGSGKFVFSLARLLSRRGDPGMALAALDSVLAFPPGPGIAEEVWYERGRLLETLGRVEEAVAAYGEGEQRYPSGPLALRAAMSRAALLMRELGRLDAAREVYASILERTEQARRSAHVRPIREDALLGLGECALRQGDFTEAARRFEELERTALRAPTRERAAFERAEMLFYDGNLADAEAAYYELTDHYPTGEWVNDALARILLLGEHAAAGGALTVYARVRYLVRLGAPDSALVRCREGLQAFAGSPVRDELRFEKLRLLGQLGRRAEADSSLARLLREDPESRSAPAALFWFGGWLESDVECVECVAKGQEYYEALVLRYPQSLEARRARARLQVMRTGEEPS
jgi:tetratricopeptide (TPR) repeat protein